METTIYNKFLSSFFALFQAYIKELKIKNKKATGVIKWKGEEEEQPFYWVIKFDQSTLLKLKSLCEFLLQNNLTIGDKINVSLSELKSMLQKDGWKIYEAEGIINKLCSIEIKMIDDGEETDSFFVHF